MFSLLFVAAGFAAGSSELMDPERCSGVLITNPIADIKIILPAQALAIPVNDDDPTVETVCVVGLDGVPNKTIFLQVPQFGRVPIELPLTRHSFVHMPVQQWCAARGMGCPWDIEAGLIIRFGDRACLPEMDVIRGLNKENR